MISVGQVNSNHFQKRMRMRNSSPRQLGLGLQAWSLLLENTEMRFPRWWCFALSGLQISPITCSPSVCNFNFRNLLFDGRQSHVHASIYPFSKLQNRKKRTSPIWQRWATEKHNEPTYRCNTFRLYDFSRLTWKPEKVGTSIARWHLLANGARLRQKDAICFPALMSPEAAVFTLAADVCSCFRAPRTVRFRLTTCLPQNRVLLKIHELSSPVSRATEIREAAPGASEQHNRHNHEKVPISVINQFLHYLLHQVPVWGTTGVRI